MNTKANIIIIEDEKNICNFIERLSCPPRATRLPAPTPERTG